MEQKIIEGMRLGKQDHVADERTLKLGELLAPAEYTVPNVYDVDAGRKPMPLGIWGNDRFGDCVFVADTNHLVRHERLDTRKTLPITEAMVVDEYRAKTGCQSPGDANDNGYVMLQRQRERRAGWKLPVYKGGRTYAIDAFGSLSGDSALLRAAAFLLGGIQLGLSLPFSAADQMNAGQAWDFVDGPRGQSGSWGGHAVYVKHFDQGGMWCVTWGREQYMTNRFINYYADERWAQVDKIESHSRYLDQQKLRDYLTNLHPTQVG